MLWLCYIKVYKIILKPLLVHSLTRTQFRPIATMGGLRLTPPPQKKIDNTPSGISLALPLPEAHSGLLCLVSFELWGGGEARQAASTPVPAEPEMVGRQHDQHHHGCPAPLEAHAAPELHAAGNYFSIHMRHRLQEPPSTFQMSNGCGGTAHWL